ncbi:RNA-dependent RNA polymerase 1 [Cryptococcus neoformans C23]|uniref:RNA-dependent RNA polymerase n=2 Tax=Cryptococcus neoformans TaxID=5207 RepID=A0A854Q9Q6_CRYNE|nr:RNA-dependent RNA polymerase 1 [Cryptococcus neoformans var. grubii H99]AUB26640.1 RNA-dependent RNA polymerase 1 [Cryptococcus neoformans var. grubii]OWZ41657.1 RNA-dependent RNA polymerase 1 [Cryptococcus neoformans var. grubii C23]OXG16663.1 RNA-dependent RNA polymerase 1 [Cryptococcus neoformans var. grubii Tu259-1]OXG35981.1 RNA-dependent RNA polymerase 1 [Cryptococcus neoformans var. grubii Bt15]OXG38468.1 RNA-dependent RNA polymerase 1 [Cryptococcus neoformans var. grubii Bt120]|eukprot:XP_012050965.1 RNA-dependent RNA polymerase 1 [Cryptococcus neoformans var. grubii H99]
MTSTKYGIHAYPPKFSDPQFIKRLMADYGQRSMPRPGKGPERTETSDVDRFQFWPDAIAMGSLKGRQFTQVFGAACIKGYDERSHGRSILAFDLKREVLVIKAEMKLDPKILPPALNPLYAELSFDDINHQGIHITKRPLPDGLTQKDALEVTVTVSCRRPPKFYAPFDPGDKAPDYMAGTKYLIDRRRATALDFAVSGVNERDANAIPAIPEGPCAYPTFWNTYRWVFRMGTRQYDKLLACAHKIRALAQADPEMDLMSLTSERARWTVRVLTGEDFKRVYAPPDLSAIPFSTRTLLEGLIGHGIMAPGDTAELIAMLRKVSSSTAFHDRILEALFSQQRIRDIKHLIPKLAAFLRRRPPYIQPHLVLIRTVLVTPTRLLIGPPQYEPSNSVTRRYHDKLDGIIRVQFTDEEDRLFIADYMKLVDSINPAVGIMARVRRALQFGLVIGGETFYPVASSASQQKEHAMWFINNKVIDGLELRNWMGTVHETVVAKHAARMGLPFSTSRIVNMKINIGEELPDIERNGRCFTDGCGIAGREVLNQAALALNEKVGINAQPSAIQFRLGGAKGVLSDWSQLVSEYEIRLRPSMIKFRSDLADLNVIRIAKYQAAFLNRQFINIMCANGVPHELIIGIFEDAIADIKGFKDRVWNNAVTENDQQLIALCNDFPLAQLIRSGFNENPLLLDVAAIIECRALQDLKWRARVKLSDGVYLIGIADETGTLKEGEVFCQFQENDDSPPKVVVNEVLVCRAPALHPGDVRRAWAVDRPELRHLKNVIVFSTQGMRDMPSMLGGGDLDGDDYTLIWDQRFVQSLKVYDPMDYEAPDPISVKHVTQKHLNENFVQYVLNDVLGQVDNCHLALSDMYTPFDPRCLHLSEIHSTAVDFAKTGQAAALDPSLRPKEWPDFMDKDDVKVVYESKGILGKIFRIVQADAHFSPSDLEQMGYPTDPRITRFPLHESLLDRLKPLKASYERDLQYDMRRYRVYEPEIPSGIAIRNKRRKRVRDQNLNEPLREAYNILVNNVRETAQKIVNDFEFKTTLTPMQVVARHCYALTYEEVHVRQWEQALAEGKFGEKPEDDEDSERLRPKPLISFAWCFCQELVQIVSQIASTPVIPIAAADSE